MSLNFINDFQEKIYGILNQEEAIKSKINKIYLSVPQDAEYPLLLINVTNVIDISKFDQEIYEIEFEIKVFARDRNHNLLISIGEEVKKTLAKPSPHLGNYVVAGIKLTEIKFEQSTDLVTNKLNIQYKALLKKGLNR